MARVRAYGEQHGISADRIETFRPWLLANLNSRGPESVEISPAGMGDGKRSPNMTPAVVEQVIYHGSVTHLHLRLPNGDPLVAFRQHGAGSDGLPISPGMHVTACWADDEAQIVRDVID